MADFSAGRAYDSSGAADARGEYGRGKSYGDRRGGRGTNGGALGSKRGDFYVVFGRFSSVFRPSDSPKRRPGRGLGKTTCRTTFFRAGEPARPRAARLAKAKR